MHVHNIPPGKSSSTLKISCHGDAGMLLRAGDHKWGFIELYLSLHANSNTHWKARAVTWKAKLVCVSQLTQQDKSLQPQAKSGLHSYVQFESWCLHDNEDTSSQLGHHDISLEMVQPLWHRQHQLKRNRYGVLQTMLVCVIPLKQLAIFFLQAKSGLPSWNW